MSFMDWLNGLLGRTANKPAFGSQAGGQTQTRVKNRQVYEGRSVAVPEWAVGLNVSDLLEALSKHVKCRYAPNFGQKKILSTSIGADGNLIPEYDGIAGDCGAIKNFGMKVAIKRGMIVPYRYFDIKTAYEACCGIPAKCPFFVYAENEAANVNSKLKK